MSDAGSPKMCSSTAATNESTKEISITAIPLRDMALKHLAHFTAQHQTDFIPISATGSPPHIRFCLQRKHRYENSNRERPICLYPLLLRGISEARIAKLDLDIC